MTEHGLYEDPESALKQIGQLRFEVKASEVGLNSDLEEELSEEEQAIKNQLTAAKKAKFEAERAYRQELAAAFSDSA